MQPKGPPALPKRVPAAGAFSIRVVLAVHFAVVPLVSVLPCFDLTD